jgi:hypothetical protein
MEFWNKRRMMYHELGHCALGRPHLNGADELWVRMGGPHFLAKVRVVRSLMDGEERPEESTMEALWSEYLDELFLRKSLADVAGEVRAEAEAHWRGILAPLQESFIAEAARFGVAVPPRELDFEWGSSTDGLPVWYVAWTLRGLNLDLSERVPEHAGFGALAEVLLPRPSYDFGLATINGQYYPKSLRGFRFAALNRDFARFYSERRDLYLRELFTGEAW